MTDAYQQTMTVTTSGRPGVREEIAGRVQAIRESGDGILSPLLLLGVMERVGSNWVSDTLRPVTGQHKRAVPAAGQPRAPAVGAQPGHYPGRST